MDNPASDVGTALGAVALLILVVTILLSLGLSLVARRRYVAAVVRLQGRSTVGSNPSEPVIPVLSPLHIVISDLADKGARVGPPVLKLRRALLALQTVGDVVFWGGFVLLACFSAPLIMGLTNWLQTGDIWPLLFAFRLAWILALDPAFSIHSVRVSAVLGLGWLLVPPLLLSVGQTAARRRYIYGPVALLAAGSLVETWRVSWSWAPVVLMIAIGLIGMAVVTLRDPRIRGAGAPLIIALSTGLSVCTFPLLLVPAFLEDETSDWVWLPYLLMIAATTIVILYGLALFYQRKRFSDVQLSSAAFWLLTSLGVIVIVAAAFAQIPASQWVPSLAVLPVWTFAAVFTVGRWRQRLIRRNPPAAGDLLVLRVFKQPVRSETFMGQLLSFWRFAAPVRLIAGPDLAGASIEPDEFFAFITRRLSERFVRRPAEISAQVEGLDRKRDPDGRFRVNELFCVEDTWRTTVGLLMAQAGVVLLDLREYERGREGTRYEMFQLMNLVPVTRIIVLLGQNDDADAVSAELQQAWSAMSSTSPNRGLAAALQVCRLRSGSANEVKALFRNLYARSIADHEVMAVESGI